MSEAVTRALSSLPPLGEDRSGPLAPGRLSGSHAGEIIREIQAQMKEHWAESGDHLSSR